MTASLAFSALAALLYGWASADDYAVIRRHLMTLAAGKTIPPFETFAPMISRQLFISLAKVNILLGLFLFFWPHLRRFAHDLWNDRDRRLIFLTASLVQAMMFITFPLFVAGDGANYWHMAREQSKLIPFSNLIQTPGYSFFISWFMIMLGVYADPYIFSLVQKIMYVLLCLMIYEMGTWFLRMSWARAAGLVLAIAVPWAAHSQHSRPEFATGFMMMATLFLGLRALKNGWGWKASFFAGLPASVSSLCRLNSCFIPLSLAGILLVRAWRQSMDWRSTTARLGAYFIGLALPFGVFLFFFHYPFTGTLRYTISTGWHTTYHWDMYENLPGSPPSKRGTRAFPDPADGPMSAKLYRFSQLPLEWVPRMSFLQYGSLWGPHSFPADMKPDPSPALIDWRKKYGGYPRHEYYWVHGLLEADRELTQAAFEHLRAHPFKYLYSIAFMTYEFFRREGIADEARLPTLEDMDIVKRLPLGFIRGQIHKERTRTFNRHESTYFRPGILVFQWANRILNYPPLVLLIGTLSALPLTALFQRRSLSLWTIFGAAFLYIVVSIGLSEGQAKSVVPAFPLCWLLTVFSAQTVYDLSRRRFSQWKIVVREAL